MAETSLIPAETSSLRPGYDPYPAGGHQVPTNISPLKMVHLFLRGRYLLLAGLLIVLAPLGAWIGFKGGSTIYRSQGLVRVTPEVPRILYNNENNNVIPMFKEYLEAEAARMASPRVRDQAMQDPEWKTWSAFMPANIETRIAEELEVTPQPEMLEVTVWDADPKVAMLAVKTLIAAYQQIYEEQNNLQEKVRDDTLFGRKNQLTADADDLRKQILELAQKYGTDDLQGAYEQKHVEQENLGIKLRDLQESVGLGYGLIPHPEAVEDESEEDMIAKSDPRMEQAIKGRDKDVQSLRLMIAGGLMENNYQVVFQKKVIDLDNQDINKYKSEYEHHATAMAVANPAATRPAGAAGATTRPQIQRQVTMESNILRSDYDKVTHDLFLLGQDKLKLDDLKAEKTLKETELQETSQRLDQLNVEAGVSARLEVVSNGDEPVRPSDRKDTHPAMAALGGGGGAALAALIVTLLGFRDRRLHGPEDTQMSSVRVPMLGMLPTLNSDLADPEQAAMAAHFVHGIRAMLQIRGGGERGRVLAITSPSAHNGKTSLSLALGVSFAGAHSKTLLIDCDFIGRALSSRVNAVARPRLGHVLRHEGLIDEEKLQAGLDHALSKGKRLGEALMDMGCVSQEKLEAALGAQKNRSFGVLEAIDGEELRECIAPTDIPGLSILPLGQANAEHIGSLSPAMIRQVLEATRDQYDVVIVDTGPILGSLEAAMVATQADDVVLVLSNGENRGAAERSLRYLESVGAKVAGFVFNRATPRDFERSDNAQRVSSSADRWRHARNWSQSRSLAGFGPVAQAVARSVGDIDTPNPANKGAGQNGNSRNGNGT